MRGMDTRLTTERIAMLDSAGFVWEVGRRASRRTPHAIELSGPHARTGMQSVGNQAASLPVANPISIRSGDATGATLMRSKFHSSFYFCLTTETRPELISVE
jgi:hypothetical protein